MTGTGGPGEPGRFPDRRAPWSGRSCAVVRAVVEVTAVVEVACGRGGGGGHDLAAEPSRAEPSRAGPSRAEPAQAGPGAESDSDSGESQGRRDLEESR
ncbi:hypothetical protein ACWD0Z_33270, partial [Streptomyces sp. NPDC003007]